MDPISPKKDSGKVPTLESPYHHSHLPQKVTAQNDSVKPNQHLSPSVPRPLPTSTSYPWFFNLRLVEAVPEVGNIKGQIGSDVFLKCQHIQFVVCFV